MTDHILSAISDHRRAFDEASTTGDWTEADSAAEALLETRPDAVRGVAMLVR
jgi:hypothetical protein